MREATASYLTKSVNVANIYVTCVLQSSYDILTCFFSFVPFQWSPLYTPFFCLQHTLTSERGDSLETTTKHLYNLMRWNTGIYVFVVHFLALLKAFGSTKINPLKIALSYSRLCLADGRIALNHTDWPPYRLNIDTLTPYYIYTTKITPV